MSVTSVKERSNKSRSYTEDDTGKRTYSRVYVVTCSARADGPVKIKASGLLPALGTAYSFSGDGSDTTAVLREYRFRPDENSDRIWEVTCEYSTDTTDPNDDEGDDPLDWRPRFRYGIGTRRLVLQTSYTAGTADRDVEVANTAGDPFVPGLEYDQPYAIAWIERNETEFPAVTDYVLTVNQSAFAGYGVGAVLLANITGSREYHKAFAYFKITYELQFDPWSRHSLEVKSTGLRAIDEGGAGPFKVIDIKTNTPVTKPVYLDTNGKKVSQSSNAATQTFWPYPFVDWSPLNLPNPYEPD